MTLSGACCENINASYTLPIFPPPGTGGYNGTVSVESCTGLEVALVVTPVCEDGLWVLRGNFSSGSFNDVWDCRELNIGSIDIPLTLLSCDPLHMICTISLCTGIIGVFCDGSLTIEFTE